MNGYRRFLCAGIVIVGVVCCLGFAGAAGGASGGWPFEIEVGHRPGTYWWSPGSAWDEGSIDWNLENLKAGGIGTVHIVPIYGAKGYEDRYITFLSEEWVAKLQYILKKADALGMQVDMTTGTGWCFGGPDLAREHWDTAARLDGETGRLRFSTSRMVKRAAPGGAGHMLNPFSAGAMGAYLERFDEALAGCEVLPRAQYHDSFEYNGNWCAEMAGEFRKRRGYDLDENVTVVFGGDEDKDKAARMKYDYRLTAAELHREFIEIWAEWSRAKGMLTRNQAHGSPSNLLDVYAAADIPETEMFGSPEFPIPGFRREEQFSRAPDSDRRINMMASSAAHVAHEPGKQLVSSESCTWMREHWHGTLGQMKLEMDLFFLAGVNHVIYHGSCYSAKDAAWPGWFFYASTKADWRNSIWRDMPLLNDYIARCQSVLQAGEPGNDVLVYWPIHDLWMDSNGLLKPLKVHNNDWVGKQRVGEVADLLDGKGYAYDFVSDRMLGEIRCEKGGLVAPGGKYKAIVVPKCTYMPAETMKRLADLAGQGAGVVFEEELPSDVPGYGDLARRRGEFAKERSRLRRAVIAKDAVSGLERMGVKREAMVDHGLRYIRRRVGAECWYFVANHTDRAVAGWVELGVPFVSVAMYDPMEGGSVLLPSKKGGRVYLEIEAGETFVLQASMAKLESRPWELMVSAAEAIELKGEWEVEFIEGGPALPAGYRTEALSSWTEAPDEKAKAFAGTARYTLTFDLAGTAADYELGLGDVRESARVKINGKEAANLFAVPMRARVGRYLKKGANTIEIEVTNLAANRIRDLDLRGVDWKIMHDANIVNQHYKKFDGAKWPLQPSGLLGPVTLQPLERGVLK